MYFTPIAFTACSPGSAWCSLAYGFTTSGGPLGFLIVLLVTGFFYASSAGTLRQKLGVFAGSVMALALCLGILAAVNEGLTKKVLKLPRPSHVYMLGQTNLANKIDSLYRLDKEQRRQYFANLIKNNPLNFAQIDPEVQAHWVEEAGFSFPSGHTFNAFLFAMILGYAIYFNRSRPQLRNLYVLPFAWALCVGVSRVALGAHSPLDVCAGAALGIVLGTIFLHFSFTRHWLTRKN